MRRKTVKNDPLFLEFKAKLGEIVILWSAEDILKKIVYLIKYLGFYYQNAYNCFTKVCVFQQKITH